MSETGSLSAVNQQMESGFTVSLLSGDSDIS